ncbi:MAG: methionyl-tRNA formyltransferase [Spirochaetota bacterium]
MNIAFFGSPELSVACLDELRRYFQVKMVVTQSEKRGGRGKTLIETPVADYAQKHGIDLYKPQRINAELLHHLRLHEIELIVVVAYGKILPGEVIRYPKLGSLNLHASLLPKYRGPSPIEAVLLNGESETGITIQLMDEEVDAGDILATIRIPLDEDTTQSELLRKVIEISPGFLTEVLREYLEGKIQKRKQDDSEASYCRVIKKGDGLIRWEDTARAIHNRIRAYDLWPVAHTTLGGKLLRVYRSEVYQDTNGIDGIPGMVVEADNRKGILVKAGRGILSIIELQLESRKRMGFKEFMIGYRNLRGKVLGKS